jgi:drug/metabolite transporter (DMT)-like permease
VTVLFALLAAFSNALNVTTQHIASTSGSRRNVSGWRLAGYLIRSPLWLFGAAAAVGAFVFQAAALNRGELSVVQALLVTELVFGLILRRVWIGQSVRRAAWASAALTCVGLAVFVVLDEPQGGTPAPTSHAWAAVLATCGGAVVMMVLAARWGSPRRRAALYATAAATVWALEATFIKTATQTLTRSGVAQVFTHWPVYAVAVGGIVGTVLVQAALHVGPLSVSQPLLVIVDPSLSIVLSIWLFQEHYAHDTAAVIGGMVGFVVMCVGVVVLTRTAPATMGATDVAGPAVRPRTA